jgi:5S rRNA maturation endonuclease (ribonuclease M5)
MEELTDMLEQINKLKNSKKLVIVEGLKDKEALAEFGITNVVILKKALFSVAEQIAAMTKDCVILTDLDAKGKEIYGRMKRLLEKLGVRIDDEFRDFLFENTELRQIEGLVSYVEHLEKKY